MNAAFSNTGGKARRRTVVAVLALPLLGMMVVLLFPHGGAHPGDANSRKVMAAESWLVWSLLALLLLMVVLTAAWVLALRRRAAHPDPALALLDEMYLSQRLDPDVLPRGAPMPDGLGALPLGGPDAPPGDPSAGGCASPQDGPDVPKSDSPLDGGLSPWERDGDWWRRGVSEPS